MKIEKLHYYLYKLGFLHGRSIKRKDFDKNNMPINLYYNKFSGKYTLIDSTEFTKEALDMFLKVKNAYNFNIIRICIVIATIFICLACCSVINVLSY